MTPMTITLWDFTWYTRTGDGQPFQDLDLAFRDAVTRGYDTVRICAMPFLLFRSGLDTSALRFCGLGGSYGQRTRWYDVPASGPAIDGRAWLLLKHLQEWQHFNDSTAGPLYHRVDMGNIDTGLPGKIGQSVVHAKFGAGVIVTAEGRGADARVQVNFRDSGLKWLMLEYANLAPA